MSNDALHAASLNAQFDNKKKSSGTMWLLWWFTGAFGGHRFYLGDTGVALGMLFTLGGLGFWALADAFFIGNRRTQVNEEIRQQVFAPAYYSGPSQA
jgi:TM2 domain-containing membrane protein YozV